ncbi:hypothetical protein ACFQDG_15670 [Natronoarchaeum mannanilyticum]|uniref:hypothetical protein n=1 Tax=Natronoarchaeum mannanilyticum TaxID=926360 RepID=UPI0031D8B5B6
MQTCPYCDSDLMGTASRRRTRGDATPGRKSTGPELVSCPDCGEVIDGFTPH